MYLKKWEDLPLYVPLPKFLLGMNIAPFSKLILGLILGRAKLSVESGWVDEHGAVYVIYPIRDLAEALACGERTVSTALKELEEAGLLERRRQGKGKANLLFPLLPDDLPISSVHPGKFRRGDSLISSNPDLQIPQTRNKKERKEKDNRERKGARAPAVYEYDERYCLWID